MFFIGTFIILGLGFSQCFIVGEHSDVLLGSEKDVSKNEVSSREAESNVTEEWIEQPLDHFNANSETWKMRYFKRLTFWKPNGPIFLVISGGREANTECLEIDSLLTSQLANETNGALFLSEHRYYGKSMPVEIKDASSMKYLSSKQALADLATLIKFIKSAPEFKSSKVVVIGGSYPGNLAAWMRALYPNLVDAAVSSSAPILAKKDFYEYYETVGDIYEKYGSTDCLNKIKKKFNHYAELLKTSSGIEQFKKEVHICDDTDMTIADNQNLYFDATILDYGDYPAYGNPKKVKKQCQRIQTNEWAQPMQSGVEIFQELSSQRSASTAKNLFQLTTDRRFRPSFKDSLGDCIYLSYSIFIDGVKAFTNDWYYSWTYQTCTEFGYFQTTTSKKQPFDTFISLDFFFKLCQDIYGEDFNEKRVDDGVAETNALYGGLTPNVTKVVFTHGDMDPWHRLGVLKDLSETAVVRITNATSHCALLRKPRHSDPIALRNDREYVKNMIKQWINNV